MTWLVLITAILLEVMATLALRASQGLRRRAWIVPVVAGYAAAFSLLWVTLRLGMPVGVAYGVWTACGVACVAVVARYVFGDPLTRRMVVGIALIVVGVLVIELAGGAGR